MKTKVLLFFMATLYGCTQLTAQTLDKKFASTNGYVYATVQSGDSVYLGGSFTQVGIGAKGLARFKPGNTKPDVNFPELGGSDNVNAMTPDSTGGAYLAGYFDSYNGSPITLTNIIHILSDGTLDPAFGPVDDGGGNTIAMKKRGSKLYVGGYFSTLQGTSRQYLGALNAATGALDSWVPDAPDYYVDKIDTNDSLVFIHGSFSYVGGVYIPYQFAALKTATGKLVPGFPTGDAAVTGFKVDGNTLYMGGPFNNIGHQAQGLAKVSGVDATADAAFPNTDGQVYCVLPDGTGGSYIGGSFYTVGNVGRSNLAHILPNGTVDPAFNVNVNSSVECLAMDGANLYIGGDFTTVNGTARNYAASAVRATGALTSFNPNANGSVYSMAVYGGTVYMGGSFTTMKGSSRNYAAAVTTANVLASWAPNPNSYVFKLIVNNNGTSVFLCGYFTTVKGANFPYIAKVNATNGNTTSWKPNPNNWVNNMILDGSTIYFKGSFNTVNGITRQYFAAIDTSSNNPTSLRADMDYYSGTYLYDLSINAGKLYIGGYFSTIQDSARTNVARIDLASGLVDTWNSGNVISPNNAVHAVVPINNNVIVGGDFSFLSLAARNHLAAIDISNSSYPIKSWKPDVTNFSSSYIYDILHYGKDIYAGGSFSYDTTTNGTPAGVNMNYLISLNDSTGKISHQFTEYPDGYPTSLGVYDSKLIVQGSFNNFYKVSDNSLYAAKHYLAGYSLSNYKLTADVYDPNSTVSMYTDNAGNLVTSGNFTLMNYVDRQYLASIDLNTGLPTAWNPAPNNVVLALAAKDTTVFAGGYFSTIGTNASSRTYLAAVSSKSGKALTAWSANTDNIVYTLAVKDTILYAGGAFTTIKGTSRNYAAAVSTANAAVKTWAPNPNSYVVSVLPLNSYVYIAGQFTTVKGSTKNYLAKTVAASGNLVSWNPNPDSYVTSIINAGNTVYVSGGFSTISTKTRYALAAFDSATNALTGFDAKINNNNYGTITNLAASGKNLYIGGNSDFQSIGATARGYLAGLDTTTKAALAFDPKPDVYFGYQYGDNSNFYTGKNKLFVGGGWSNLGKYVSPSYFAVFTLEPQTQGSGLNFTNLQPTSATANFTAGSGENRLLVIKQGATPASPNDGRGYTANTAFKQGDSTGAGSFVVYGGNGTTTGITSLLPNHAYTGALFEYNGSNSGSDYLTSPLVTGNFTTPCPTYNLTIDSTGPLSICPGDSVKLKAPAGFKTYLWSNGKTTSQITVNTIGNYSVTFTDSNGCSGTTPAVNVVQKPAPDKPAKITGKANSLCNLTNVKYTAAVVTGATSYAWTVPSGCTIVSGQGSKAITVNYVPGFVTGYIILNAVNSCGTSAPDSLKVIAAPPASSAITGPATVTAHQAGVVYSVTAVAGLTYTWTVPGGAVITSGQGTSSITVTFGTKSGSVAVTANNACASSAKKSLKVTVGSSLIASADSDEDDATMQKVTAANVYPNPANTNCTVVFNAENNSKYSIIVADITGKQLLKKDWIASAGENKVALDINKFAEGMYLIMIINDKDEKIVLKLNKE